MVTADLIGTVTLTASWAFGARQHASGSFDAVSQATQSDAAPRSALECAAAAAGDAPRDNAADDSSEEGR
jgi:hypothetical protein